MSERCVCCDRVVFAVNIEGLCFWPVSCWLHGLLGIADHRAALTPQNENTEEKGTP